MDEFKKQIQKEKKLNEKTTRLKNIGSPCLPCQILVLVVFAAISIHVKNRCIILSCAHNSSITNSTCNITTEQHDLEGELLENWALELLFILIFLVAFAAFDFLIDSRILCHALCAKIPLSEEELNDKKDDSTSSTENKRYVFVDFNAWEYAGSESLWAAIVINLATAIEKEFRFVTSRLFRLIGFEIKQKKESQKTLRTNNRSHTQTQFDDDHQYSTFCPCVKYFLKLLKSCCCRAGDWIILILFFVAAIIIYVIVASSFESIVEKYTQVSHFYAIAIAWITSVVGFILAIRQSHTKTINEALKGTKTNMAEQLGFMHTVKKEVQLMTEIVRCAESVYNRKYCIVISIDDLDRVDLDKVKSVLDAVNILLSDKNSPFVCLIAVDSRIAVKSIEENMRSSIVQSNVTGVEYLKKIINLPFCLPEISDEDKKQFVDGLLAWTYKTFTIKKKKEIENRPDTNASSQTEPGPSKNSSSNAELQPNKPKTDDESKELNHENFIEKCQEFLSNDPTTLSYLDGNPRNIKRIFNILSLTLRVIQCIKEEPKNDDFIQEIFSENNHKQSTDNPIQISRDLVTWVILTEQWPYSMSYILHVIAKNDNNLELKIENNDHLLDIYENLQKTFRKYNKDGAMLQDRNQEDFTKYLEKLKKEKKTELNKEKVNLLKKITINLDQSYMQIVQRHSNLANLKQSLSENNEDGNSDSPSHTTNDDLQLLM